MPDNPYVSLTYSDLHPTQILNAEAGRITTPEAALEASLLSYRMLVVHRMKQEIKKRSILTAAELLDVADLVTRIYLGRWSKAVGPSAAAAYLRAYQDASVGDVPMSTIYALANQHTDRLGEYFNETSKEALTQGFNTLVNQKVPQRVAAERVVDAFGLTPRQMSGYTSLKPRDKTNSAQKLSLGEGVRDYIGRSLRSRFKIFAEQEGHNLKVQSKQTAWVWMQSKGMISPYAQKVWLTARDEMVCPQCAPLHGKRILITDQFELTNGIKLWVPGAHTGCRCDARLVDVPLHLVQKDLKGNSLHEFNEEHPRGEGGRFSAKSRAQAELKQRAARSRTQFTPVGYADPIKPSPFLEELLERALEVGEEEETLTMKPTERLSMQQSFSMAPSFSMPKQDQTKFTMEPEVQTKQSFTMGEKARQAISMGRESYSMPEGEKLKMSAAISAAMSMPKKPTKPRNPKYEKPVHPLNTPIFTVVSNWEVDRHGNFAATADTEWYTDASDIHDTAQEIFESSIDDAYQDVKYSGQMIQARDGSQYQMLVPDDEVYEIIEAIASSAGGGDPDWYGEHHEIEVQWVDENGDPAWTEKKTYGELAATWGLTPEQFEVRVIRLDEGHDSSLGRTFQEASGTKHGSEVWRATGPFVTNESARPLEKGKVPIIFLDAQPDVEVEIFHDDE